MTKNVPFIQETDLKDLEKFQKMSNFSVGSKKNVAPSPFVKFMRMPLLVAQEYSSIVFLTSTTALKNFTRIPLFTSSFTFPTVIQGVFLMMP